MVVVPTEEKSGKEGFPSGETNPDYGDQPPPAYDLVVSEFPPDIPGPSSSRPGPSSRASPPLPPRTPSSSSPPPSFSSSPALPAHPHRSGSNHNKAASTSGAVDHPALKYAPPTAKTDSKPLPSPCPFDALSPKASTLRSTKSSSWLSMFMPSSNKNTKQVRTTVLNLARGLVLPNGPESPQTEDVLARAREICSSYDLNLSTILQEYSIEGHTPIYWAIISPRREQLLAPLVRCASPLNPQSLSDIRRACLAVSDQPLYQAYRTRGYPFNSMSFTDPGSALNAADALVLGDLKSDDVQVEELDGDGAFIASFEITLWQKRLRVAGKVSIQFIARGRLWQITFFSSVPQSSAPPGKAVRKLSGSWYASLSLLEHSSPTHVDSLLVVDVPKPSTTTSGGSSPPATASFSPPAIVEPGDQRPHHSSSYPPLITPPDNGASLNPGVSLTTRELTSSLRNGTLAGTSLSPYLSLPTPGPSRSGSQVSLAASQYGELLAHSSSPSLQTPSPGASMRLLDQNTPFDKVTAKAGGAIMYRLTAYESQLARKAKGGKGQDGDSGPKDASAKNVTKSETWTEKDVHYINRLVVPLCDGPGSSLMYDDSPFLSADGTLRGRLEARLMKTTEESTKDCVIC
ncbi:hypothetical protein CONPUDRAFT_165744 [Coniophora puteana RWD-64-598 SS2]|uniref:Uncharacterized protein n=1 Tax=Coniophora puteana (strain RWD-64-598) TaxID=741705 RepID=A0A5M3MMZ8_CONPW|nr:uncharacterized protein CONPUDRAFT_165744 [Coniophora puteana RWD-64-598 SS2]EIW80144.1 hypothetical protein CONPUDRAFT_165744 [Coniophora puteana RWD-64-598 SS2]